MVSIVHKKSWTALIAVSVGIVALWNAQGAIGAAWGQYGWVTNAAFYLHELSPDHSDHETVSEDDFLMLFGLLEEIRDKIDRNRDEWACDELDEDLLVLELRLAQSTTVQERVQIEHDLTTGRERWDALNCIDFQDGG